MIEWKGNIAENFQINIQGKYVFGLKKSIERLMNYKTYAALFESMAEDCRGFQPNLSKHVKFLIANFILLAEK